MSAINILLQPTLGKLHIGADGASYTSTGVVAGIASKFYTQPHWPGVLTSRGAVQGLLVLDAIASQFRTFDAAVRGVAAMLPDAVRESGIGNDRCLSIILAGYSRDRQMPEAYIIWGTGRAGLGVDRGPVPFVLNQMVSSCASLPDVPGLRFDPTGPEEHCADTMRSAFKAQRLMQFDGMHLVGGFAEMVTITPSNITTRLIDDWPGDRVGELIRPAA